MSGASQDREEGGHREQRVQDAEDPAADVGRELLLERGLGRNRDQGVGDPRPEGDNDDERDDRQQRAKEPRKVLLDGLECRAQRCRPPGRRARWPPA